METNFQIVYDLADKIEMPTGDEQLYIAKGKKNLPKDFNDKYKKNYVANLDANQALKLGELISKEVFPNKDYRYRLNSLQKAYNLVHSKTKEGKKFKKLNRDYWFHNREKLQKLSDNSALFFPDPVFFKTEQPYDGKSIKISLNTNNIFDALRQAGHFKELKSKPKTLNGGISFDRDGYSSVRSDWNLADGCFLAGSGRPSYRYSGGLATFEKTDEMPEIEKVEIAKREYNFLLEDSKKYKELKPIFNDLTSKLEKARNILQ